MFKVELETDNDSFQCDAATEINHILSALAGKLRRGETEGKLFDSNGNSCGTFSLVRS